MSPNENPQVDVNEVAGKQGPGVREGGGVKGGGLHEDAGDQSSSQRMKVRQGRHRADRESLEERKLS